MPAYNGVFATISVDGQPLDEYQVQENDILKEVSCWIPSQVGKAFTVCAENLSLHKYLTLAISLDGCQAPRGCFSPKGKGAINGIRVSETEERSLLFSEGKLVDDDNLQGEMQNLDSLGTIVLSFREGNIAVTNGTIKNIYEPAVALGIPGQRLIPERGKKGIQTCVALGPVKARPRRQKIPILYTGNVTRVIFRYRPLDYLQAQGIAPPPLPPQQRSTSLLPPVVAPANKVKRTRADDAESEVGLPEAKRTQTERKKLADVEIGDNEDIEELQTLRARIDTALAKKNVQVKKEIKTEPANVFLQGGVIDLT